MKRLAVILALLLLAGCGRHYDWHQKITLHISTPDGPVVASSVQAVWAKYIPKWLRSNGFERDYDLRGEAVVADLGDGRYLFALLPNPILAERVLVDRSQPATAYLRQIERLAGAGPQPIPARFRPRLVSFTDIADPTSVFLVDPDDLVASFGPGYRLDGISIEITREPVTEGVVEGVLGQDFFKKRAVIHQAALERGLSDPYFDTLSGQMNRDDFIKGF